MSASAAKSKPKSIRKKVAEQATAPVVDQIESNNTSAAEAAIEENATMPAESESVVTESESTESAESAEPTFDEVAEEVDLTYVVGGRAYLPSEIAAMSVGQLYDLTVAAQAEADAAQADVEAVRADRAKVRDEFERNYKAAQRIQLKEALAGFDAETSGIVEAAGSNVVPALVAVLQERAPKMASAFGVAPAAVPAGKRGPRHDLGPIVLGLAQHGTTLKAINEAVKSHGGSPMSQRRFALTYSKYTDTAEDGVITLNEAGRAKLA